MTVHNCMYVIDDFFLYWLNRNRKFLKLNIHVFAKKSLRRQCDTNLNQYDLIFLSESHDNTKINFNNNFEQYLTPFVLSLKITSVLKPRCISFSQEMNHVLRNICHESKNKFPKYTKLVIFMLLKTSGPRKNERTLLPSCSLLSQSTICMQKCTNCNGPREINLYCRKVLFVSVRPHQEKSQQGSSSVTLIYEVLFKLVASTK